MAADDEIEQGLLTGTRKPPKSLARGHCKTMAAGLTTLVALAALWSLVHTASVTKHTAPTFPIAEREQLNWAQYSPYIALGKYKQSPGSCKIDQVRRSDLKLFCLADYALGKHCRSSQLYARLATDAWT